MFVIKDILFTFQEKVYDLSTRKTFVFGI